MLKINDRTIEAVAALLYNSIYDLGHVSEGAWCAEARRDDPAYLAFAGALLQAVRSDPDTPDPDIIQHAVQLTRQNRIAGFGWETIVIDQEYTSLPSETETVFPNIKSFITDPGCVYLESTFLDFNVDVD
jgi:hypothetical protein